MWGEIALGHTSKDWGTSDRYSPSTGDANLSGGGGGGCESVATPGSRGYNYVNYHLIYYGERGVLWHGECMRSTECILVFAMLCKHSLVLI